MTLVVGCSSATGVCLMADRRITFGDGRTVDDAVKVFNYDATDGSAIFGYAGLGQTAGGTEPSEWMLRCLRNLAMPVETAVYMIYEAMAKRLAPHLKGIAWSNSEAEHCVLVLAIVNRKPRQYFLSVKRRVDGTVEPTYRRLHYDKLRTPPVLMFAGGSGAHMVSRREALKVARAHADGRVSDLALARYFASVIARVHLEVASVGRRSVGLTRPAVGGGMPFAFDGTENDVAGANIPQLSRGLNMSALAESMLARWREVHAQLQRPPPSAGSVAMQEYLAKTAAAVDFPDVVKQWARGPTGPDPTLK